MKCVCKRKRQKTSNQLQNEVAQSISPTTFSMSNPVSSNVQLPRGEDLIQRLAGTGFSKINDWIQNEYETIGGGDFQNLIPKLFSVRESNSKESFGGVVKTKSFKIFKINPKNDFVAESDLIDVMASFAVVLEKLIDETTKDLASNDKVQVILSDDNGVMLSPVSSALTSKDSFDFQQFLLLAYQYFQSGGKSVKISDGLKLEIVTVTQKKNTSANQQKGGKRHKVISIKEAIKKKTSCISIENSDNLCMARCIAVGLVDKGICHDRIEVSASFFTIKNSRRSVQRRFAEKICDKAQISYSSKCGIEEAKKFEQALRITIKILDGNAFLNLVYEGQKENEDFPVIFLLRTEIEETGEFHYDFITNICKFLGKSFYCNACDVASSEIHHHTCSDINEWCYTCYNRTCQRDPLFSKCCSICFRRFKNADCEMRHQHPKSICKIYKCFDCNNVIRRKEKSPGIWESNFEIMERHRNCKTKCNVCKKFVAPGHVCFMTRQPFKQPVEKVVFIDYETNFESGEHIPVFCCISWIFEKSDGTKEEGQKCFGVSSNISNEVGKFLFSKQFQNSTVIAHNFKGFDSCFLIQYLTKNNIKPSNIILNGTKVNYMFIKRLSMRMIDSLNLSPIPLSMFSSSFGLNQAEKGFFPYRFIREENFDYVGPYPEKHEYGYSEMKLETQKEFDIWYNSIPEGSIFNFREEIAKYCIQDIVVLKKGVEKFRELMKEISTHVLSENNFQNEAPDSLLENQIGEEILDCQSKLSQCRKDPNPNEPKFCDAISYTTLASLCHGLFKANYLRENTIAQVPAGGYENHKYSSKALEWLEYLNVVQNKKIIHRLNSPSGTEVKISKFRVDGYEKESKTVFEFNGCFYHGHPECITNMNSKNPVLKLTFETLFRRTIQKRLALEKLGYKVETMWECHWNSIIEDCKNDEQNPLTSFLKSTKIPKPLNPFEAFYGGRVETFCCLDDNLDDPKQYVDVTSLYPFVCKTKLYPVGHPTILYKNLGTSLDPYFGFIQCKVKPPRQLMIPVLPVRLNGKLLFPLCAKCASEYRCGYCVHSEEDRCFSGVWFSEELKLAVKKGYEIVEIEQVYHFKQQSSQLFSNFMNDLYKIKLLASGAPTNVDLDQFIKEIKEKEKIDLSGCKFDKNPGLRYIAKILLNSFWGRFALRENQPAFKFITSVNELYQLLNDANIEIKSLRPITENVIGISYLLKDKNLVDISNERNIFIAAATTAWARIEVYKHADKISTKTETQLFYVDTDGLIFSTNRFPFQTISTGNFMGDLTNELKENEWISLFLSAGPKNYAYQTNLSKTCVKVKGFSLHSENLRAFNCDSLKQIIENYVQNNCDEFGFVSIQDKKSFSRTAKRKREEFESQHNITSSKPSAFSDLFAISVYNPNKIVRTDTWHVLSRKEQKLFLFNYDKRIIRSDFSTLPFGYCQQ